MRYVMNRVRIAAAVGAAAAWAIGTAVLAQTVVGPSPEQPVQLAKPVLSATKTVDKASANPGDTVTYTVTITNTGDGAAQGLKLADILPVGLTVTTTGGNTYNYAFLGTLEAGKTMTTSYSARIGTDVASGDYVNVATVSVADPGVSPVTVRATVNVTVPVVKGAATTKEETSDSKPTGTVLGASNELPATGPGQLDVFLALLGASLAGAGVLGLRHLRRA